MTKKKTDKPGCGIKLYFHCKQCVARTPYLLEHLEIGWTKRGLQVYCPEHKANIIAIDFEGTQHKTYDPGNVKD